MKRVLVGLTTLGVVVSLGWCALAWAQRGYPPASNAVPGTNSHDAPRNQAEPGRLPTSMPARPVATNGANGPIGRVEDLRSDYRYPPRAGTSGQGAGQQPSASQYRDATESMAMRPKPRSVVDYRESTRTAALPGGGIVRTSNTVPAEDSQGGVSFASDAPATTAPQVQAGAPNQIATPPTAASQIPAPFQHHGSAAQPLNPPQAVPPQPLPSAAGVHNLAQFSGSASGASSGSTPAANSSGIGKPGSKNLEGPQSPSLIVEKISPAEVQVGKPAKFSIVVRNVGTAVAQDVEIRDDVPSGTQLLNATPRPNLGPRGELVWSVGNLKPNEETTVSMELLPTTEGELGSVAVVRFAASGSSRSICTRPELVLDVSAPREVLAGENVTLSIRVSNPGTGVASHVVLSEQVPPNLEHPAGAELEHELGDLRPGETRELDLTMKAAKAGKVVNRLLARADAQLQATKESTFTIVAPAIDVALEGSRRRFLDRPATYTLVLSNPGTAAAQNVSLVAQLPPGMQFVEANNAGQFDPTTRSVHWLLDELPAQEMGKVTLTAIPNEAGDLSLRIAGTAARGLSVEKQESIRVEGVAALVFQVIDLQDPIEVGGETTYEVRITNQGSKVAENVTVLGILPPEMKPLSAEGPTRYDLVGQQVAFQPLPRLNPKSDAVFHIRVQALRPGDCKIGVQVKSADLQTPVTKEEATRVFSDP